jgi:photosynthetic reaction center cytochrome c subunit
MSITLRVWQLLAATLCAAALTGCERPPMQTVQYGYRGTAMQQSYNPRTLVAQASLNEAPAALGAPTPDGPKAKDIFKNLQVLGDLSVADFTRNMLSITQWVAPKEGCAYCHDVANMSDDGKYTKVVARRMIQMTQHVNADWKPHVGATGVTCYTCHRGNPVPAQVWFAPKGQRNPTAMVGYTAGQNLVAKAVGTTSLPGDPFTPFLLEDKDIRIEGAQALAVKGAGANRNSLQQTEHTFGLMVHMSGALGVNCTFCHNTRSFQDWERPQRVTAWHGIRMARDLNNAFMTPLTGTFPADRLGPHGDVAKVNCGTCHQGAYKPLYGAPMAKDFPELLAVVATTTTTSAAAPALPPPVAEPKRVVLYFAVGAPTLADEQAQGLAQLISTMAAEPGSSATISGFHSAAGALAQNQELAKQRAFTVRDALLAGGIAESRVKLEKPQQTEANAAGEDATARRVEVTVK